MLPVGAMLQGKKYIIDRYLSSGGFGNTYVATNLLFEEKVAIKEFYMRGITERNRDSINIGIFHLDIKPENIMIDSHFEGSPIFSSFSWQASCRQTLLFPTLCLACQTE